MSTVIITGRDVSFTLDTKVYAAQTTSATLACDTTIERYTTLNGPAYRSVDKQWTFTIELLQDWGSTATQGSLFENMWNNAENNPNTPVAVSLTAATGAVFTFTVLPIFPSAGGAAPGALTDTWALTVIGTPTETYS
jgi:hypothetical protein